MNTSSDAVETVVVVTHDKEFAALTAMALRQSTMKVGDLILRAPDKVTDELAHPNCTLAVCDLDGMGEDAIAILADFQRMAGAAVRFIAVIGGFSPDVARGLLRLKLADFLVKPVDVEELAGAIDRLQAGDEDRHPTCDIISFLPCAGGVGNTTLALQSAFLLHEKAIRQRKTTCLVDLNLQHGSAAEYLDLEPHFDISEIETQPDRLDRQLLDVMLSRHKSGLAIVSAPHCPWEMRNYRPDLITRLLDLVSTHFDTVVIDLPGTWFPWTDSVLMGSDRIFLVTEMTVPAIRHTQRIATAVRERIGPSDKLGVLVNRVDAKGSANLTLKDVQDVLGDIYRGSIANDYKAVRSAIDQGRPLKEVAADTRVLADLKSVLFPDKADGAQGWSQQLRGMLERLGRRPAAKAATVATKGKRHA